MQNHTPLSGPTGHRILARYTNADYAQATGPLKLQDHGEAVRFRNLWVRPLKKSWNKLRLRMETPTNLSEAV